MSEQSIVGKTILVIDDERDITEIVKTSLEDTGLKVIARHSADKGLQAFRDGVDSISLVLLDIALQGESGINTLEAIRALSSDTPVVFISGYIAGKSEAKVLGAADVLRKPFTLEELETTVRDVLRRQQ